jgi:hypothetical protein
LLSFDLLKLRYNRFNLILCLGQHSYIFVDEAHNMIPFEIDNRSTMLSMSEIRALHASKNIIFLTVAFYLSSRMLLTVDVQPSCAYLLLDDGILELLADVHILVAGETEYLRTLGLHSLLEAL